MTAEEDYERVHVNSDRCPHLPAYIYLQDSGRIVLTSSGSGLNYSLSGGIILTGSGILLSQRMAGLKRSVILACSAACEVGGISNAEAGG